jgi:hypothetical protein
MQFVSQVLRTKMGVGDGKVVETDQQMLENYGKIVEK